MTWGFQWAATRALAQTTDELAVAGADTVTLLARQARLQAAVAKLVREIDEIRAVGGQALETAEANLKAAQQAYDTLLAEATATGTAPSARVAALRTPALVAARKALAEAKRAAAQATDEAGAQWLRNGKRIDPPEAGTTPTGTTTTQFNVLTNTSCFPGGTMLLTPSGSKPIEAFRPGDLILSRPEHEPHHAPQPKAVEALFRRMALTLRLTVSGQTIETTGEHPFHVVGKGWRMARELVVGDVLESHNDQRGIVERLEATRRVVPVYNLRVADWHTYFVGCDEWGVSVWAHNAEYTVYKIEKGRWGIRDPQGEAVPGLEFRTMRHAQAGLKSLQLRSWEAVATPRAIPDESGTHVGRSSGRPFFPGELQLRMQRLTTNGVQITNEGIARVEQHVARFGPDAANQRMLQRLRDIAEGRLSPTQTDLNFYTHELREFEHYSAMGWARGVPDDPDAARHLWNNAHTATLEEFGLREGPGVLYVP